MHYQICQNANQKKKKYVEFVIGDLNSIQVIQRIYYKSLVLYFTPKQI